MNTVIHNINIIIGDKGLKKKSVADKAGYTRQQFSDLLNGRRTIKSDDVLRIAIALEVTPNDLLGITAWLDPNDLFVILAKSKTS